jgi:UDP-N-acetylglucosamine 1-carboxyvinyltransferase
MLQVAHIPALGGCAIGGRQINFHTQALELFGANVDATSKGVKLTSKEKLKGIKFRLDYPSVGATEQILMTAVLAEGITELSNAAIEPEILDLINILQKMGAIITVDTNRTIIIEGVESLYGYNHTALTDRIETASWASAALATDGNIFVKGAKQSDLTTFLNIYRKVGGDFIVTDDGIKFFRGTDNEGNALPLKSIALETDVHPGFATDWQQPLVVALTQAEGISVIHETVYEKRFGFINTLNKMGAKIQVYKECLGGKKCRFGYKNFEHSAVISGPSKLTGTDFEVPDLRGGFSYLIAALTADGVSHISNLQIINRGYENFEQKLRDINANFEF